ncbi:hypothetical protein L596_007327 [Steinernema carpocapsae]|uniref:Uncharacterized protein n=1 Tax=Steinernema carpocapsae TaxID=34508 RepID=A0A4U5P9M1_STECR|nr:hypothetical protein L596_007327 [Steinernema carpocapsae]
MLHVTRFSAQHNDGPVLELAYRGWLRVRLEPPGASRVGSQNRNRVLIAPDVLLRPPSKLYFPFFDCYGSKHSNAYCKLLLQ